MSQYGMMMCTSSYRSPIKPDVCSHQQYIGADLRNGLEPLLTDYTSAALPIKLPKDVPETFFILQIPGVGGKVHDAPCQGFEPRSSSLHAGFQDRCLTVRLTRHNVVPPYYFKHGSEVSRRCAPPRNAFFNPIAFFAFSFFLFLRCFLFGHAQEI